MSTTKFTGRENLTKYAFWLDHCGPTDKENQVKMYVLGTLPFEMVGIQICIKMKRRIRIRIKGTGSETLIYDHFHV